jgi:hypothetical protein
MSGLVQLTWVLALLGPGEMSPVPVGKPHGHSMLEMPALERVSPETMEEIWGKPQELPELGTGWMFVLKPEHNPEAFSAALVIFPKGKGLSVRMWGASMIGPSNAHLKVLRRAAWGVVSGH